MQQAYLLAHFQTACWRDCKVLMTHLQ